MAPRFEVSQDGLWGKPTTTWDWCEKNYEVSNKKGFFSFLKADLIFLMAYFVAR